MFCLNDGIRFFLCLGKTDMRKGMDTLSGVVRNYMGGNPVSGNCFIFINGRHNLMKLLHYEPGGMVMYMKRLEKGTYRMPRYDEKTHSYSMKWSDLVMMVEGIKEDANGRKERLILLEKQ